jgi:hypothetical protein
MGQDRNKCQGPPSSFFVCGPWVLSREEGSSMDQSFGVYIFWCRLKFCLLHYCYFNPACFQEEWHRRSVKNVGLSSLMIGTSPDRRLQRGHFNMSRPSTNASTTVYICISRYKCIILVLCNIVTKPAFRIIGESGLNFKSSLWEGM